MSGWAVAVAFGGALLGGLLGTLATISHERSAELRSRRLNAAEGFLTAAMRASSELRVPAQPTADGIIEGVARASEVVAQQVWPVQLLFGLDSLPAGLAREVSARFAKIAELLVMSVQPAGLDHAPEISNLHREALGTLGEFSEAASRQVQETITDRARRRLAARRARRAARPG